MRLSPEMLRVLYILKTAPWSHAEGMCCSIATMIALEQRKLIHVQTTFAAITYPRRAEATITAAGVALLRSSAREAKRAA